MDNLKNYLLYLALIIVTVLIVIRIFSIDYKVKYKEQVKLYDAITDSLQHYKTSDSLNVAKIKVIETERLQDFLNIKNLTGTVKELQELIINRDKKIKDLTAALVLKDETIIIDTLRLYYPIEGDTIIFSKSILLDTINTKWYNIVHGFRYGYSYLDLKVYNEYNVLIGYENGGLFKKGTPYATITNLNPYTYTNEMRVYQVKFPSIKRNGLGVTLGFGGLYDMKNKNFGYGPYIGGSYTYNILLW